MRPTISLSSWKIAVNLAKTRAIQGHPDWPASNCLCRYCQNWRLVYSTVFPAVLLTQLKRLGVAPEHPSELYGGEPANGIVCLRVSYHIAGKILAGPDGWLADVRNYVTLQQTPYLLTLVVQRQDQFFDAVPASLESEKSLLQIDFRMEIPWRL